MATSASNLKGAMGFLLVLSSHWFPGQPNAHFFKISALQWFLQFPKRSCFHQNVAFRSLFPFSPLPCWLAPGKSAPAEISILPLFWHIGINMVRHVWTESIKATLICSAPDCSLLLSFILTNPYINRGHSCSQGIHNPLSRNCDRSLLAVDSQPAIVNLSFDGHVQGLVSPLTCLSHFIFCWSMYYVHMFFLYCLYIFLITLVCFWFKLSS